ncbi:unnamed protein product [Oikopleura dioica]|uniref:Uncharacterized protein n=1 Tax=Oikopleura dioica TaxID=34765 RepID=E4XKV7_OIKDI|nr:unnamed protein product [Oikopleura dioica]
MESVDLNLKRPQNRANEDELAQLETEVRKKIGKIYEKITGFVQQGALTPNTVRQKFPDYEVVQSNNTQEVLSRQVTPEAGAFDFTCDNSFSQQGRESRTMSYYSIKDAIPETIPEETSLEAAKSNGDFLPRSYDQVQMISERVQKDFILRISLRGYPIVEVFLMRVKKTASSTIILFLSSYLVSRDILEVLAYVLQ